MSTGGAVAASVAAAAAAKKAAEMRKEEEEMTTYKGDELEGWEFKIVRSNTGAFKKREFLEKVRQEERQNGWEMLEKFDNNRIRFKRRIDNRNRDSHATIDPYRGTVGIGSGELGALIVGIILLAVGLAVGSILFFNPANPKAASISVVAIAIGVLALITVVIFRKSRR